MLSWTGLHGNMTLNQTLHQLYTLNMDDIMVFNGRDRDQRISQDNITTRFTIANGFCKVLTIKPNVMGELDIHLKGKDSFKVVVNDPESTNGLLFSQISGDKMIYDKEEKERHIFLVHLKETEDKTGQDSCVEYPNSQYETFSECIKDDIVKKTRTSFGFGLPFFSEKSQMIKPIERQDRHETTVQWLFSLAHYSFGGIIYKPDACLSPCTILTAISEQQHKFSYTDRVVSLHFNDIVQVQTTVLAYGFDSLLVEVGSSLGLWLGLSLVGVFNLLTAAVEKVVKWIQHGKKI